MSYDSPTRAVSDSHNRLTAVVHNAYDTCGLADAGQVDCPPTGHRQWQQPHRGALRPSPYVTMQLFDLAAIAVPVLLTYGVEDVAAPVGQGRWLAAHIPTVEVWESQTGGHLPAHRRTRRRPCRPPPTSPPSELAAMSTRSTSRVSHICFTRFLTKR